MDDRELVRRCIAGEQEGWRELVRRHQAGLEHAVRLFLRRAGVPPRADRVDEICARTYERLWEKDCAVLRSFRWDCSLATWINGLARLMIREELRREGREASLSIDAIGEPADVPEEEPELAEALRSAMAGLSDEERRAVEGVYFEGRRYEEVARRLGVPFGTVAGRVARAKKFLFSRLSRFFSVLLL